MKKQIVSIVMSGLLPVLLFAQSNPLDGMMKKYSDRPGFNFMEIKTNMFGLGETENTKTGNINPVSLNILSYKEDGSSKFKASDIYDQFRSGIDLNSYKGVAELKSSGDKVEMMIRKKEGGGLSDIILIIYEKDELTIIAASGDFDLDDISRLNEIKNCQGIEIFNKLCEE